MKHKIGSFVLSVCLLSTLVAGCTPTANTQNSNAVTKSAISSEKDSDSKGNNKDDITLTIWDWDEAHLKHMTELYQKTHPNIHFETLVVPASDYMQKLQSALASGTDVPDIILGELMYRGRLFELGILEDLSVAPYQVKKEDMFDFAVQLQTGPKGELLGVEQQICPSGFAYRRDLAKTYLGTDDPHALAEMISTWDKFIALGEDVVKKSEGKVTVFPGISLMLFETLKGQNPSSYIEEDTIDLTSRYSSMLELGVKMNQAGILGNQERGTPAVDAGFAGGEFIFFPCPPWALKWNIEVNDPDGTGNWGLTKAPESGFTRGGTSVSIYSDSPNKEAAWEYIQFVYCEGEGVKEAYEKFGFMTGFKAPYEDKSSYFFNQAGAYDAYFGGQDLTSYYINEISLETKGQIQTKHETNVLNALLAVTAQMANDKTMTAKEALELLKQETAIMIPEAKIK